MGRIFGKSMAMFMKASGRMATGMAMGGSTSKTEEYLMDSTRMIRNMEL